MSMDRVRAAYCAAVMAGVLALAGSSAMAEDIEVGKQGPFTIHRIHAGGKFDRCAATLQPGPSMLRIHYNKALEYHLSTPPAPGGEGPVTMKIDFGAKGVRVLKGKSDGRRASVKLDPNTVELLMGVKKQIAVDLGAAKFVWQIGAVNMEDVFVKMEDCTQKAVR